VKKRTVVLGFERETKNTYRYQEVESPGEPPILRTLYLQKWFTGNPAPEKIKVTIEAA